MKHPSSDIYKKNISLKKINNIIRLLHTSTILLSSFVIYFFCICNLGCFPILLNFLLTAIEILISDNFVCLPHCLPVCICRNLYIGSRLYFSTRLGFTMAQSY